jgi:hypothetical protein
VPRKELPPQHRFRARIDYLIEEASFQRHQDRQTRFSPGAGKLIENGTARIPQEKGGANGFNFVHLPIKEPQIEVSLLSKLI